jgi:hypothetical protein
MSKKLLGYFTAGVLAAALALASPALAGHGGGGGRHGMGGGMGGGMGTHSMGGMGMHPMGGGVTSLSAVRPGTSFAAMAMSPHFAQSGFHHHDHFFHHRRFFFVGGAPYYYTDYGYDDCLRRVWTGYGVRWVNVCGDSGY